MPRDLAGPGAAWPGGWPAIGAALRGVIVAAVLLALHERMLLTGPPKWRLERLRRALLLAKAGDCHAQELVPLLRGGE